MKVRALRATPVTVPLIAPILWSMGVEVGTTRTIIELETDEGPVGLGETYGGSATVRAVEFLRPLIEGLDLWQPERLRRIVEAYRIDYETYVPPHVLAGIEMAWLDALGKHCGQSVAALLGGVFRTHIPCSAYMFFRRAGTAGVDAILSPEALRDETAAYLSQYGFGTIKLKGGVLPPDQELATLRLLRAQWPDVPLRYDPNAAWAVETCLRFAPQFRELGLEYLEDLTDGLPGMARARAALGIPFATNMCVTAFSHIPVAVQLGAVDVILADVHYWGGLRANLRLAAIAETFHLGLGMHSDRELGISTAAQLHLAAAVPTLTYAIDSHYLLQADDVITTPFRFHDGGLDLPAGPGLGVELDRDKLRHYHERYQRVGDVVEFGDPERPGWIPVLPLF